MPTAHARKILVDSPKATPKKITKPKLSVIKKETIEEATGSPLSVKLDAAAKKRLQKLGKLKQRSVHWLMKEAILRYLEEEEYEEEFNQETERRWKDVEEGKVVSNEAVMAWLSTWGTDHPAERPACGT